MSRSMDIIIDEFIEVIKKSDEYKEYARQQDIVRNQPDVLEKINELRMLNLAIQSTANSDQAYDEMERFEKRFDELSEDKRVFDFIEAENIFIAQYQEIYRRIMEQIQFI